ncbi:MAG: VWA domain-containing protein [Melioribacteraceae bacterium]|nr:VWA domain-containing protein [Melioribacteraceae bacterium]MCF8355121.1 VWA domain-containing protein [Melioribacteraceae bacterium]MCF8392402.1 VWA domain-containing protein [Melioribacteraceae bacterium]MCF8417923.1 VWA domain-containing protein [Melioribacteraceae bacterium]
MFRFAHTDYLYFLYAIPLVIALYWFTGRYQRKLLENFADSKLQKVLYPLKSSLKSFIKFAIISISIVLLIFALANPQIGSKIEEVKQVGIDVYICLDVSLSMTAEDIKPSRLNKAKHEISRLIQRLQGDRIGLIVFSGDAYIQFPLTTDYSAANLFLNAVSINTVPQPGTAIASAIELASNSFKEEEETQKAIIVITDGEDHEGNLEDVIDKTTEKGISIYTIGLGSPSGVPIPVYNNAGVQTGYKKDRNGETVLTKLDEATLKELASKGNGEYYRGSNSEDELEKIYNDLSKLEEAEYGATKITEYEDRYYYFLIPALILLFAEIFISNKKSKLFLKFEE